ncbi:MAG: phospholipase A, partial [Sulfurospirillum sp.]|nr:phospholipase A [Sulfurospirillum sp.]
PKSRSWNRFYAKAYLQLGGFIVAPRVWYRLPENADTDDNPNIDDYLGYGDLELIYPWGAHTFKLLARHNMHFNQESRGAVQFDWTFPLWDDGLFGYIQLYSGYAESLIDYDKRSDRIGIGFALSR